MVLYSRHQQGQSSPAGTEDRQMSAVSALIRKASIEALSEAARAAHDAGDFVKRDRLADRFHEAVFAGVGTRVGISSLSHD
jgi:DNA-binding GntR family transcriptional regulator